MHPLPRSSTAHEPVTNDRSILNKERSILTNDRSILSLSDAVRAHAAAYPEKIAVTDADLELSFEAVNLFSDWFAQQLIAAGVDRADGVLMTAPRQAILLPCILGVFKAGAAHVPIDARMPDLRLEYILRDNAPRAIILERTQEARVRMFAPDATLFFVEDLINSAKAARRQLVNISAGAVSRPTMLPNDTAYCIYTSGSTGRPKGVLISHRSITQFFGAAVTVYDVVHTSRCASFSPMHFDVYLMDMLLPLYQGATLYVFKGMVAPDAAFDLIRRESITHFSAWGMMLGLIAQAESFGHTLPALVTVLTGTDVPDVKTVQSWLRCNSQVKVVNAYGPTEVTCAATAYTITERNPARQELYPIGLPLPGVSTLLVDDEGKTIRQPGVSGELLLGGAQVMQGYKNLDAETATRLVDRDGETYYRTGDICVWTPADGYRYLGRKDNEVSLGGYRVHLNEVERVINSVDCVHNSVVVALTSQIGEKVLAAGVLVDKVRSPERSAHIAKIRERLREELAAYMVPRHLFILDDFPRLPSDKPDRSRLSEILRDEVATKRRRVER